MEEQEKPAIDRRNVLKRVGTVAAGIGAVTAASAMAAEPASASAGENLVQGANSNITATSLSGGTGTAAPLTVTNPSGSASVGAPALTVTPMADDAIPAVGSPTGSVFSDNWGDLYTVGRGANNAGQPWVADVYSDNWANMAFPITPYRFLVTKPGFKMPNGQDGLKWVVPGSAYVDGNGYVYPNGNDSVPDMIIDFTDWFRYVGFAAVQGVLNVLSAPSSGWISFYDSPVWPGTASHSFPAGQVSNNFVQSRLYVNASDSNNPRMRLNVKVSGPVFFLFDVSGFITNNPYRYLHFNNHAASPLSATDKNTTGHRMDPNASPTPKL